MYHLLEISAQSLIPLDLGRDIGKLEEHRLSVLAPPPRPILLTGKPRPREEEGLPRSQVF